MTGALRERWSTAAHLALVAALVACGGAEDESDGVRHRLVSDAELACLAAYDRDRHCLGEEAAGTPEAACPMGQAGTWYDTYGADCVRAHIDLWECLDALDCGEDGCVQEDIQVDADCRLSTG